VGQAEEDVGLGGGLGRRRIPQFGYGLGQRSIASGANDFEWDSRIYRRLFPYLSFFLFFSLSVYLSFSYSSLFVPLFLDAFSFSVYSCFFSLSLKLTFFRYFPSLYVCFFFLLTLVLISLSLSSCPLEPAFLFIAICLIYPEHNLQTLP